MKKTILLSTLLAAIFTLGTAMATPVDINHADAKTIAKALAGVGQAKAEAIVAYRDAHGPFKTIQDLGHVKGIGPATIRQNQSDIKLGVESHKR